VTPEDAAAFERCIAAGGVALFPADTVYGLAADPQSPPAVERLYEIKGRPAARPAAVMFFALEPALAALAGLGGRTRAALTRLLPGPVTAVVTNPERRYPLACGPEPERLGVRVPDLRGPLEPLRAVARPVLQSSANPSGGADARRLQEVDPGIAQAVDLALDGGELPGTPSTVIDLTDYETGGRYRVLRAGALAPEALRELI
jgi:L-threonylcarbamoyladenylate synthase